MFDFIIDADLHGLHQPKLRFIGSGVPDPHLVGMRFESTFNIDHYKFFTESIGNGHGDIRVCLLVYKHIVLLQRSQLMPEHSLTHAISVNLCVVKSFFHVKGHFILCVEDEQWHQFVRLEILHKDVEGFAVLLGVHHHDAIVVIILLAYLEVVYWQIGLQFKAVFDLLHEFFDALVCFSVVFVELDKVSQRKNDFFWKLFLKLLPLFGHSIFLEILVLFLECFKTS